MRDIMILRAPGGEGHCLEGTIGMAMRRLSIMDLSGGWQPLFGRQGQIVVFHNGEIYNYRELKSYLEALEYTFATQSDTELLAHGL